MKTNKTNPIKIAESDLIAIDAIANKYGLDRYKFCSMLSKKNTQLTHPIRFSEDNLKLINENSVILFGNINVSKYCRWIMSYVIDDKIYMQMKMKITHEDLDGKRKQISFTDESEYLNIQKLCSALDIKFATLVRYFAVNISIEDMIAYKNRCKHLD